MGRRVMSLLVFGLTVLTVTAVVRPTPRKLNADAVARVTEWRRALTEEQPEVVLLGNSLLGWGINEIHFSYLTGVKSLKMWDGGVESSWLYLMLKNVISPSAARPKVVIVFFMDQYLTDPSFRIDGVYKERLDALRGPVEPVLDQLAYGAQRQDPMSYAIARYWSLDRARAGVRPRVEAWTKEQVGDALSIGGREEVDRAISRVFADSNLNETLFSEAQIDAMTAWNSDRFDFEKRVEHSFLPEILSIGRESGIRLIFVRIKRLQCAEAQEAGQRIQYPMVKQYADHLRQYLESRNILFLDFSEDPRILARHFALGDHLGEEGRYLFTRILAEELEGHLPAPKSDPKPYTSLTGVKEPIVLEGTFIHQAGYTWRIVLKDWESVASSRRDAFRSVLTLYEDGNPLGPGNSYVRDIESAGKGRYVQWGESLYFSTSDGSDPNKNGHLYSYAFEMPGLGSGEDVVHGSN